MKSSGAFSGSAAKAMGVAGVIAVMAALLLVPAMINGFPFIFYDTGTYLRAAVTLTVPEDRPIYYSVFARALHWHASAWPIVIVQSLVIAALILALGHRLFAVGLFGARPSDRRGVWFYIALAAALCLGTSLPWFAGLLIPDIFAPALIIAILLTGFCWDRLSVAERIALPLGIALCISFHYGNLLLALGGFLVFAVLAAAGWRPRTRAWPRFAAMAGAIVLGVAALILPNAIAFGQPVMSPGGSSFLLGRLLDDGSALDTLKDECPVRDWRICAELDGIEAYRLSLIGNPQAGFSPLTNYYLWLGPLTRLGGFRAHAEEAREIVGETIARDPLRVAGDAAKNVSRQLFTFQVGDGIPALPAWDFVFDTLDFVFGSETSAEVRLTLQAKGAWPFERLNILFDVVLILSLIPLAAALVRGRKYDPPAFYIVLALVLFLIGNAAATGGLSGVFDRYQARVIWLMPLFGVLLWRRWGGLMLRAQ